jgi:hypothetical protein
MWRSIYNNSDTVDASQKELGQNKNAELVKFQGEILSEEFIFGNYKQRFEVY